MPAALPPPVPEAPTATAVSRAAAILRAGGLVAFPTETVYGLGAHARSPEALRRLFAAKGRPADHPVIVHLAEPAALADWAATVPPVAATLAEACWPGPLTVIVRRAPHVPDEVTGGLDTVGLRVPAEPVALALLRELGDGIAAPSANRFGRVSPTTAADVVADLGHAVDLVLDGGPCRIGVESTIVDCTGDMPSVLRLGGVTREEIEELLGCPVPVRTGGGTVRAPGTLASHYAPNAQVLLVGLESLAAAARDAMQRGMRVGVLGEKLPADLPADITVLAQPADDAEFARELYRDLRAADALDLDIVLVVLPGDVGLGAAVADRLRRAAGRPTASAPGDV